ncbi:MAG: T9SS type A sorting domain-containing protein [Flavobacteriales bacterium]|nr:T9SS type A sorting domain-containing protein [Flavobacteriales bacterium]
MHRILLPALLFTFHWAAAQQSSAGHYCQTLKQQASAASAAAVNDSMHIQHYDIRIDSLNFTQKKLWGRTQLTVESKVDGLQQIHLSLAGFTIDSVIDANGTVLNYTYDNLNLNIALTTVLNATETDTITIAYRGVPAQDASWGGFYWNSTNYAYNMGVGFNEDPHVFGRAWFPCLDVFTDRATYDFHIKVWGEYQAYCNGNLAQMEDHGNDTRTYHWTLAEPIPTYLASMAVAKYHFLERDINGIPAVWAALPQDTLSVLGTFLHLPEAMNSFISSYGSYRWEKIGYALVPFSAGAMEHASSIHIGKSFVDGSLNYETLWAHELAHMWWGDLVTCKDEQNMWLNEGFAAYSEALFTEAVYGEDAYKDWIRQNHRTVLQFAHVNDGDYLAMNAIPHAVTYGSTVYEKGPEIIHTLRNYMGDALFFEACRTYMDSLAFGNADSYDLRDIFAYSSGVDLNPFFDGWVFQPGFPHFTLRGFNSVPILDGYSVDIAIKQKQRGNNHIYEMPIEVNLTDGVSSENFYLDVNSDIQIFTVHCQFDPKMVTIDRWEKMSDAIADFEWKIGATGDYTFNQTNVVIDVLNAGNDSSIVRIADHFVTPDDFLNQNPGFVLNPYHYWSVDGIFSEGFHSEATFKYNGANSTSQGYMDNELIIGTEDSLVFLYRSGTGTDWQEVDGYELQTGVSITNKQGTVRIDTLKKGEYVLGRRDFTASISSLFADESGSFAFPNPSNGTLNFTLSNGNWKAQLIDLRGKRLADWNVSNGTQVSLPPVAAGNYILRIANGTEVLSQKLMVQ